MAFFPPFYSNQVIALVFILFFVLSIDEIARARIMPRPHIASCSVCGKSTPAIPGIPEKDTICAICKRDIKKGIRQGAEIAVI